MNFPLSPEQHKFLTKYGYIRLSEWRLLGHSSKRLLNPSTLHESQMSWFYIGSPPYIDCAALPGSPMEKPWPKESL